MARDAANRFIIVVIAGSRGQPQPTLIALALAVQARRRRWFADNAFRRPWRWGDLALVRLISSLSHSQLVPLRDGLVMASSNGKPSRVSYAAI
jgi:hypothetical protein